MTNQLATNLEKAGSQPAETSEQELEEKVEVPEETEEKEEEPSEKEVKEPEKIRTTPRTVPIERFNEIYGNMRRLERLATILLEEKKTAQPAKLKESEPEVDWDVLTPKEFAAEVRKANKRDLQEALDQTLTPLREQNQLKAAQDSIEYAAAKYEDFFTYRPEMIELAERYPNLDAESLYLIVTGKKGAAGEHIMQKLKNKVTQKKNALTERRSSAASRTTTPKEFKSVRDGALAAAKELGYDV